MLFFVLILSSWDLSGTPCSGHIELRLKTFLAPRSLRTQGCRIKSCVKLMETVSEGKCSSMHVQTKMILRVCCTKTIRLLWSRPAERPPPSPCVFQILLDVCQWRSENSSGVQQFLLLVSADGSCWGIDVPDWRRLFPVWCLLTHSVLQSADSSLMG